MKIKLKKLFTKADLVIKTKTFQDTGIVFGGNVISSILGAIFFFLLAHQSGAYLFGVFSVVIAISTTAVDLFDIAINNAIVGFGSNELSRAAVVKRGLIQKIVLAFGLSILLWIFAPVIIRILDKSELLSPLRLAVWLIPARSFFSLVKTILQSMKKFFLDAIVDVFSSAIRLLGFYLFPLSGLSLIDGALLAYISSLALSSLLAIHVLIKILLTPSKTKLPESFHLYQSWMVVSFVSSAIASRLDIFFLTRLTSLTVVGWYQAAFRLFMPVQQLASSLSRVFAPRFASFVGELDVKKYLKKSLYLSGLLAMSIFLTLPFLGIGIAFLYGKDFIPAISIAFGLSIYFAVFLFSTPYWSALLYFRKDAKAFARLSLVQLILMIVLLPITIKLFGVAGAVASLVVALLSTVFMVRNIVKIL